MNEEKIDRRAHWIQALATLLVLATAWCVKLEFKTSQMDSDFAQYKKDMKSTLKELDNAIDATTKTGTENTKDIEWLKREKAIH